MGIPKKKGPNQGTMMGVLYFVRGFTQTLKFSSRKPGLEYLNSNKTYTYPRVERERHAKLY